MILRLGFLLKSFKRDHYSLKRLQHLQNKYLSSLLDHASKNSPYYRSKQRKIPEDTGFSSTSLLTKLPVVTKSDILENQERLLARNLIRSKSIYYTETSGTTGAPLLTLKDSDSNEYQKAISYRNYIKIGSRGRKLVVAEEDGRDFADKLTRTHYVSFDRDPEYIKDTITSLKPSTIALSPSILEYLVTFDDLNWDGILVTTTGEVLADRTRRMVEEGGGEVRDFYATEEFGKIAYQCKTGHYHINTDLNVVELHESDAHESAKVPVITSLSNYLMPLIRFRTGDLVIPGGQGCSHSNFPYFKAVIGRESTTVELNGKVLTEKRAKENFLVAGVRRFYVDVKSKELVLDVKPSCRNTALDKLRQAADKFGLSVEFEDIPLNSNHKNKVIRT